MTDSQSDVARTLGLEQRRGRSRLWIAGLVVAAVGLAGLWYWSTAESRRGVTYETAEVALADLAVTVTATGTVEPTNLVEISSEVSGTIKSVLVEPNDPVRKGQVLAELDTSTMEAQLDVRRASVAAADARVAMAEAMLGEARAKYDAALELEERGIASRQAFISAKAAFDRAAADLKSAEADRELARANFRLQAAEIARACICSPVDGIVLSSSVEAGQIIAASFAAPVMFTIAEDLRRMELRVNVDEADIGRVAVGNEATFTVDAHDDQSFPARIAQVRFAPETTDGIVTYKAILSIANDAMLLRPGMTATADITVRSVEDALVVPNAALRYQPPAEAAGDDEGRSGLLGMLIPARPDMTQDTSGERAVWVLEGGVGKRVPVVTGDSDGEVTEITGGAIEPGMRVITRQGDG